jgi:anti-sigma B factor antagonist
LSVDPGFGLSLVVRQKVPVVHVSGELDLATVPALREALLSLITADHPFVVVDLTDVSFIDSTALSALTMAHKRLSDQGGEMRLVMANPVIKEVFEITALDDVLSIYGTVDDAVSSPARAAQLAGEVPG